MAFRCVIHGSFSKHFEEIRRVQSLFTSAGIEVLAPKDGDLVADSGGFGLFEDEIDQDPRFIELLYLQHIKQLGQDGFSYFVNPEGYIGKSASYELGIAQATNTQCFFLEPLSDHPAYIPKNSIWSPHGLVDYILEFNELPPPIIAPNTAVIHRLWEKLLVPGSVVAAGAMIEYQPDRYSKEEKEILLVKTHKWGHRYSIVGGKVRRNERLHQTLLREVGEETGLKGEIGRHICTFDQIRNSGYYQKGVSHIFVDNVVQVISKRVILNDEAQDYLWIRPSDALKYLDIEPNARATLKFYQTT